MKSERRATANGNGNGLATKGTKSTKDDNGKATSKTQKTATAKDTKDGGRLPYLTSSAGKRSPFILQFTFTIFNAVAVVVLFAFIRGSIAVVSFLYCIRLKCYLRKRRKTVCEAASGKDQGSRPDRTGRE